MAGLFLCKPFNKNWLKNSSEMQKARGPDFNAIKIVDDIGISVNVTELTDSKDSTKQPVFSKTGKTLCIIDGKLFNAKELIKKFKLPINHVADGSVVAELYEEIGKTFVDEILGIFSIIIYDLEKKLILANRDMVGVKPLYWVRKEDYVIFSSCLTAMPPEVLPYVRNFPPGKVWTNNGFKHINNCQIPLGKSFEKTMLDSVADHIPGKHNFGLSLSGGIDSAIIASMAKKLGYNFPCFVFDAGAGEDERAAKSITDYLGLQLILVKPSKKEIMDAFPRIVRVLCAFRSEIILGGLLSYFIAKQVASEGLKFLLTGEGIDVIFGGMPKYKLLDPDKIYQTMINDQNKLWHATNRRMDHCASIHSVEPRAPFEDLRVIANARRLPLNKLIDKNHKFEDKIFLRELALKYLPEHLVKREKQTISEGTGILNQIVEITNEIKSDYSITNTERKNFSISSYFELICFCLWKEFYPNMARNREELIQRTLYPSIRA